MGLKLPKLFTAPDLVFSQLKSRMLSLMMKNYKSCKLKKATKNVLNE